MRRFQPLLAVAVCAFLGAPWVVAAEGTERHSPGVRTFDAGGMGHIEHLGIKVAITPDAGAHQIYGFMAEVTYQDPIHQNAETVHLLGPAFIPVDCSTASGMGSMAREPSVWHNDRGVAIAVTFVPHCKDAGGEVGSVPFLETQIWFSDPAAEVARLEAIATGKVFDLVPSGHYAMQESPFGKTLRIGQQVFKIASIVMTIVDVVALSRGTITLGSFAIRLVVGFTVGELVDEGFEYAIREHGMEAVWKQMGWHIRCRICGEEFFREELRDGELLVCPRHSCRADAYLDFDDP
jgi:hypothetical protein